MGGARQVRKQWRQSNHYHYYEGDGLGYGYVREVLDLTGRYFIATVPGGRRPGTQSFWHLAKAKRYVEERVR